MKHVLTEPLPGCLTLGAQKSNPSVMPTESDTPMSNEFYSQHRIPYESREFARKLEIILNQERRDHFRNLETDRSLKSEKNRIIVRQSRELRIAEEALREIYAGQPNNIASWEKAMYALRKLEAMRK